MNQEQQGKWKEARKNLLETAKKYPKSLVNVIDSAYLAGLEQHRGEELKAVKHKIISEFCKNRIVLDNFKCSKHKNCRPEPMCPKCEGIKWMQENWGIKLK